MTDEQLMQQAIDAARRGIEARQTPFGACIARAGQPLAVAHNAVWAQCDPTAHAEVRAIRQAARTLGTIDLRGCVIYATCEPCPMCFAAIHWARIDKIIFCLRIADAAALGFRELSISSEQMKTLGSGQVALVGDFLREPCLELFRLWLDRNDRNVY